MLISEFSISIYVVDRIVFIQECCSVIFSYMVCIVIYQSVVIMLMVMLSVVDSVLGNCMNIMLVDRVIVNGVVRQYCMKNGWCSDLWVIGSCLCCSRCVVVIRGQIVKVIEWYSSRFFLLLNIECDSILVFMICWCIISFILCVISIDSIRNIGGLIVLLNCWFSFCVSLVLMYCVIWCGCMII